MSNWQQALSTVFELAVIFLVPAVVWATLAVGLYQLVRDRIRQVHLAPRDSRSLAQRRQAS